MNKERGRKAERKKMEEKMEARIQKEVREAEKKKRKKNITQGMFIMRKIVPATARSNGCLGQKG